MDYEFINIDKNLIPYTFDIVLGERTYTFFIKYNAMGDFFNLDLYLNDVPVIYGLRITYGVPLFLNHQHLDVPQVPIIPFDLAENEDRVTWDNFNNTVFLWIPLLGIKAVANE